jgi:hypothetical protein
MCSTFMGAEGTAGMMTDGMAPVGIGAGIACVKAWDGAANAVGMVGNVTSFEKSGASGVSAGRNIVKTGVISYH